MSSAVATPLSNMRIASRPITRPSRLDAKPGESCTSIGSLPIRRESAIASCAASFEVSLARTTSTSFMMCTGLKKCMPTTRSGRAHASAMIVIGSDEVLVASNASAAHSEPSLPKILRLRSMLSGTASITTSASRTAASKLLEPESFASAASRSAGVTFCFSTPLSRFDLTLARPRSSAAWSRSTSRVSTPHIASAWAIPCPIVPAPITAAVRTCSTVFMRGGLAGSLTRHEHDLARDLVSFEHLVRRASLAHRQHAVDDGLVAAGADVLEDLRQRAARPHRRTEHREVLDEQMRQRDRDLRAGRSAARDQPPVAREAAHRNVPSRRPDVLDHDVGAAALRELLDLLVPRVDGVIDDVVGAELAAQRALALTACGRDHARA